MNILPLVNWNLGTGIIIFFGVVCIALLLIVHNMVKSDDKKK